MSASANLILAYKVENHLSYRELAERINKILALRAYGPRSVTHAAVHHWARGISCPDPLTMEFVATHGDDESLSRLAQDVLAVSYPTPA